MVWYLILLFVVSLLVLGYFIDRRTDRYKSVTDKKVKENIEKIKDETQKHNPPNSNNIGPW
ncbi:hypothetical protein H1D32_20865 [Anaerobacillus sp. CMMVII]|uniref:hypothetical protein n=1 Tax=Anaerobacillus sp. CMMVII TaxID=2755588 RepID=UPI0021B7D5A0|nr:hypothetical protein [Anaerobacillus sp. CMMVII]MCT8139933.1 hypothetical protein [Anaerobacillus sp. CMMVII]